MRMRPLLSALLLVFLVADIAESSWLSDAVGVNIDVQKRIDEAVRSTQSVGGEVHQAVDPATLKALDDKLTASNAAVDQAASAARDTEIRATVAEQQKTTLGWIQNIVGRYAELAQRWKGHDGTLRIAVTAAGIVAALLSFIGRGNAVCGMIAGALALSAAMGPVVDRQFRVNERSASYRRIEMTLTELSSTCQGDLWRQELDIRLGTRVEDYAKGAALTLARCAKQAWDVLRTDPDGTSSEIIATFPGGAPVDAPKPPGT
jgi:hypothetical protein